MSKQSSVDLLLFAYLKAREKSLAKEAEVVELNKFVQQKRTELITAMPVRERKAVRIGDDFYVLYRGANYDGVTIKKISLDVGNLIL